MRIIVAQAKKQLAPGKEPLPGERTGTVRGMRRLNKPYCACQAENETAVQEAKARRRGRRTERGAILSCTALRASGRDTVHCSGVRRPA